MHFCMICVKGKASELIASFVILGDKERLD